MAKRKKKRAIDGCPHVPRSMYIDYPLCVLCGIVPKRYIHLRIDHPHFGSHVVYLCPDCAISLHDAVKDGLFAHLVS
jgi:hypothetical protein